MTPFQNIHFHFHIFRFFVKIVPKPFPQLWSPINKPNFNQTIQISNSRLSCKCNWLVIPYVDLYDQQHFTCPTEKISTNLLDGYNRPNRERNENIFRRKWHGTKNDLINNIRNGTIDSFCDPKSRGKTCE